MCTWLSQLHTIMSFYIDLIFLVWIVLQLAINILCIQNSKRNSNEAHKILAKMLIEIICYNRRLKTTISLYKDQQRWLRCFEVSMDQRLKTTRETGTSINTSDILMSAITIYALCLYLHHQTSLEARVARSNSNIIGSHAKYACWWHDWMRRQCAVLKSI